jgi:hypothetical protein
MGASCPVARRRTLAASDEAGLERWLRQTRPAWNEAEVTPTELLKGCPDSLAEQNPQEVITRGKLRPNASTSARRRARGTTAFEKAINFVGTQSTKPDKNGHGNAGGSCECHHGHMRNSQASFRLSCSRRGSGASSFLQRSADISAPRASPFTEAGCCCWVGLWYSRYAALE